MDKQIIKSIIGEGHQEIRDICLVERPVNFEDQMNYVLIGIRRAGKSYLMLQDIQCHIQQGKMSVEDCLYIRFEDERLSDMKASELGILLDCYKEMFGDRHPYIYLDEIQNVEGWETFARRLADQKYRVMVTGSNAKMLSKEMSTTLGGRYIPKKIFPFSYCEYLQYHGIKIGKNWQYTPEIRIEAARRFDDYFYLGGLSEIFPLKYKREWINALYQKIILGDIVARHKIRGDRTIRLLGRKLAENVMQPTAISRLQHIIKSSGDNISLPTLKDYLAYMEECYLIFSVSNFVSPISEQETIKKRYFTDNGLLNNLLFQGETKLLENLCAITLIRRYPSDDEPRVFYYNRNIEVDFYIPEDRLAVQAAYDINDHITREREVGALVSLNKTFPLQSAYIITRDQEETITIGNMVIHVIPIWKWLLL